MIAEWINSTFYGFDYAILEFFHGLWEGAGAILTPIAEFFALIGDNGYFSFLIAFILLCFPKTRKCGVAVIFAVGFGALFTNVAIKNIVARPRPYASEVAAFKEWWAYVGAHLESEFSFPSGHTTAAMASMTALCIAVGKSKKWVIAPAALYVLLMGASRNYLMVHYPSDIIGGILAGAIGAILGFCLVQFLYKGLELSRENKISAFLLDSDIRNLFKKKQK
jgi:undecaprenyl-diphosphatase